MRKIVAKVHIPKDTIIEMQMIACKRNNIGLEPKYLSQVIGKKAKVDFNEDDPIEWEKLY